MTRPTKLSNYQAKKDNIPEYIRDLDNDLKQLYAKFSDFITFNSLIVGSTNTNVSMSALGDMIFVGDGSGLAYGSMYNHDTSTKVDLNTPGISVATRVPSGFTAGQTNMTTFQNAREIVVSKAGRYAITWSISFSADASNKEIEGFVMIDNTQFIQSSAHRRIGTASDTGAMGGTCIADLASGAVVALGVTNETAGGDLDVNIEHSNMTLLQVGGT